jgi:hypothetical protein
MKGHHTLLEELAVETETVEVLKAGTAPMGVTA